IVGTYQDASFNSHGFLGVGGVLTTVDQPNASSTNVNGINNSGQIVGWGSPTPGVQASGGSFLDVGGVFTTINVPGEVYGISNKGQMVGSYVDASGANHGFLNVGGVFTTVDEPGAWLTAARGVNSTGQVVGYYYDNTGVHGFLDIGGVFTTINVPGASYTYAYGINDAGQIVGDYGSGNGVHGFLDVGGVFTTVDVPGAHWTTITGINNSGQIVGYDYDDVNGVAGPTYGFLATPVSAVPEPSSLTISVVAIALVLAIKLRFFR